MKTKETIETVTKTQEYLSVKNKALHYTFKVDLAVPISESELERINKEAEERGRPYWQNVLADNWNFFVKTVGREVVDGIKLADSNDRRDGRTIPLRRRLVK